MDNNLKDILVYVYLGSIINNRPKNIVGYEIRAFKLYHSEIKFSRRQNDDIFLIFSQPTGFDISCNLPPVETICMKCQILFIGENRTNISKCCLLKILPDV